MARVILPFKEISLAEKISGYITRPYSRQSRPLFSAPILGTGSKPAPHMSNTHHSC